MKIAHLAIFLITLNLSLAHSQVDNFVGEYSLKLDSSFIMLHELLLGEDRYDRKYRDVNFEDMRNFIRLEKIKENKIQISLFIDSIIIKKRVFRIKEESNSISYSFLKADPFYILFNAVLRRRVRIEFEKNGIKQLRSSWGGCVYIGFFPFGCNHNNIIIGGINKLR